MNRLLAELYRITHRNHDGSKILLVKGEPFFTGMMVEPVNEVLWDIIRYFPDGPRKVWAIQEISGFCYGGEQAIILEEYPGEKRIGPESGLYRNALQPALKFKDHNKFMKGLLKK